MSLSRLMVRAAAGNREAAIVGVGATATVGITCSAGAGAGRGVDDADAGVGPVRLAIKTMKRTTVSATPPIDAQSQGKGRTVAERLADSSLECRDLGASSNTTLGVTGEGAGSGSGTHADEDVISAIASSGPVGRLECLRTGAGRVGELRLFTARGWGDGRGASDWCWATSGLPPVGRGSGRVGWPL